MAIQLLLKTNTLQGSLYSTSVGRGPQRPSSPIPFCHYVCQSKPSWHMVIQPLLLNLQRRRLHQTPGLIEPFQPDAGCFRFSVSSFQVLLILTVLVLAAAFVGLEVQWSEQWESAHISLQALGPFLHIGAVFGMTLLAWPVASCFYRTSSKALKSLLLLLYLAALLALYLAPLGIDSPCLMEHRQLPPKPALFGHRGAPMLAPENTMMSFQKALHYGVSVWETDLLVSADGVPFIMHDEKLTRTTNVQAIFPDRAHANATSFQWNELQQLDAGTWFMQKPPFLMTRSFSSEDRYMAGAQRIISLKYLLREAKKHNMSIMFDLRPEEDPNYEHLVNVTVETILQSGIAPEQGVSS
uniref:GP-PDE domain-containing protein n=1 Tax=Anolis carolinensis TaxID=28377 RepID=A0A803SPR6_ANOCA